MEEKKISFGMKLLVTPSEVLDNKYIILLARLILGLVFIFASIGKISHPISFAQDIWNYNIISDNLVLISAIIIPWVEFICGLLLISGFFVFETSINLLVLLIIYEIAIVLNMFRGRIFECGCGVFGKNEMIGWNVVIRDLILILIALIPIKKELSRQQQKK